MLTQQINASKRFTSETQILNYELHFVNKPWQLVHPPPGLLSRLISNLLSSSPAKPTPLSTEMPRPQRLDTGSRSATSRASPAPSLNTWATQNSATATRWCHRREGHKDKPVVADTVAEALTAIGQGIARLGQPDPRCDPRTAQLHSLHTDFLSTGSNRNLRLTTNGS